MAESKKIKIAYFPSSTLKMKVISSNGISLDEFCTKATSMENINGDYTLDATFTIDALEFLEELDILKCQMDYGKEYFKISKISKGTRYVDIVARQITIIETLSLYLEDVRPDKMSGQQALNWMLNRADGRKDITFTSDIANVNTAYYQELNLYEAIHACEQSFIKRWGGEVLRRGYDIKINSKIGQDRGVSIRERKNLLGFNIHSNIDDLKTKVKGKGYNGICGEWQDSQYINNYSNVFREIFEYKVRLKDDQEKDENYTYFNTENEVKNELNRLAKLEFTQNDVDKIKATYDINFVELEKTEQYKNYIQAERVFIGDTVRVYIKKLNVDIKVRVIEKSYDIMAQRTGEIKLSNVANMNLKSINSVVRDLREQLTLANQSNIGEYIQAILSAGIENSFVTVRKNEILIMDTKDINTARNVWRWNAGALAHSSEGYYSNSWNIGITQDGMICADRILTGVLTAILIESLNKNTSIDLNTGKILFKSGGFIGNDNCFWDLDTQLIKGNNVSIDLNTGNVNFNKGIIKGLNSEWNLNTGIFKTANGSRELNIYDGGLKSNNILWIESLQEILAQVRDSSGLTKGLVITQSGSTLYGNTAKLQGYDKVIINSGGSVEIIGDVKITGSLTLNGETVYPGTGGGGATGGSDKQNAVVNSARKLIGVPYVYGGNYPPLGSSRGTDCSGLCQWAYNDNGISISRTTYTQINEGIEVYESGLQPGDLIFPRATGDNGHVFMYSGESNGRHMCVEAYDTGYNISEHAFTWTSSTRARRIITG